MKQFILPDDFSGERLFTLSGEQYHYLCRVLRKKKGDSLAALDREGSRWSVIIDEITDSACTLSLSPAAKEDGDILDITLVQCLPKGRKMELIIRQAVEAGVKRIIPVLSDHAVPRFDSDRDVEKKRLRWEKIAQEAMQQSGFATVPTIEKPVTMDRIPALWGDSGPGLFCHQKRIDDGSLHRYLNEAADNVCIVIGPEGGLSDREIELLVNNRFKPVFLGNTVLRTETAALFATAAVKVILLENRQWRLN